VWEIKEYTKLSNTQAHREVPTEIRPPKDKVRPGKFSEYFVSCIGKLRRLLISFLNADFSSKQRAMSYLKGDSTSLIIDLISLIIDLINLIIDLISLIIDWQVFYSTPNNSWPLEESICGGIIQSETSNHTTGPI
jgi:hypothetical protein